ncbi:protein DETOXIFICATION 45, chloroplastic isoform X2 [Elaeis guineensis]|uniref:Protein DETOXIFICATION n=1 Tax=Elaeis guineensis var. tenera TaxID=51953 RepID=A0A6I9RZL8_ELAGV|nr:protein DETOXIFICATION 45, chloroplastic [Elaeis guineensis]
MKAIHQHGLLPGLTTSDHNGGGNKRMRYSFRPSSSILKEYCLSIDHAKSSLSAFNACRKRTVPVVKSQSCSDCDTGPYDVNGRPSQKNEYHLDGTKDGILKLGRSPANVLHPGNVRNELIILALPAIVGQALDPLAQLMETVYIGRLGPVELASAGVSVSIFHIISKLFNVPLLSITTSFVAEDVSKYATGQAISGRGFPEENFKDKQVCSEMVERLRLPSVSTALLLAAAIGTIEAVALFLGAGLFLNIMGVPLASPMRYPSELFLSLRALGAPAVVVSLAVQGVFRGFKDTKTPLLCVGLGNLSAVILLPVLVYSFHLGITGAAIATIASQYITTFLLLWSLGKRAVILPPKIEDLQFGGYIKSGGLLLGRTLSVLVTMTLGTSMAARQGPLAMAAHQICLQVWLAVSLLTDALAVSAQALIASSFAKCDYNRVKEITHYVLKTGLFIGIALAAVLFASFGNLAELFTKDAGVLQIVRTGVLFVSASQPINALAFIFDGLHYGVSDFSYSACSMMTVGALSSLFLLYAPSIFGLAGIWSGLTLFMSLRMSAGFLRLYWKTGPWWFLQQEIPKSEPQYDSVTVAPVETGEVEYANALTD